MAFDEDIQGAKESIQESGEQSTVRRLVPAPRPVPDPEPWKPLPPVEQEIPVSAVWLSFSSKGSGEQYMGDSLIKTGDKKVLVPALDIDGISVSDQIIRANGDVYKVEAAKLLDPNGQKILWTLQVRQ